LFIDDLIVANKSPACVGIINQFIPKFKGSVAFDFLFPQKPIYSPALRYYTRYS